MRFILASSSPRRREILKNIGLEFEVCPADIDESALQDLPAETLVKELALLKAAGAAKKVSCDAIVIGADTIVQKDGEILGKPEEAEQARQMLKKLSGSCHTVYTGVCCMSTRDAKASVKYRATDVWFKELTDEEIDMYIKTNEPMDKAGAYGIQEIGSMLIDRIDGDYFNVVGLSVSLLYDILNEDFGINLFKACRKG